MNLNEEILTIGFLMKEQKIPDYIKRRIDLSKIDEIVKKAKLRYFHELTTKENITSAINFILGFIIPDNLDEDEWDTIMKVLTPILYLKYGESLEKYFKDKREEHNTREKSDTKYSFIKHDKPLGEIGWRGFSESFEYFDDLLSKYSTWVEVDWDEVKRKLDNMDSDGAIRIANIGDDNNRWGYNFSIYKKKIKK